MLHLFNKVYLEFDDKIEHEFDRVVVSEEYGKPMLEALDKVAGGKLISYAATFEEAIGESFITFITSLKDFSTESGKKIIIYCDGVAYKRFLANWFKAILPELTVEDFNTIVNYTIYNQRVTSNTQLSSVYSINLTLLWNGIGEVDTYWRDAIELSENEKTTLEWLTLDHSYEFLLASYLSGNNARKEELRATIHKFLIRWFKEMFTDNRQMVLLNITNHAFQTALGIDPELVDITRIDPLAGIPQLEAYADDEIWERNPLSYGKCVLEGLEQEKIDSLKTTIIEIFNKFEGMQTDRSIFDLIHWADYTARETLTDEEMDGIINYMVEHPFDTIGIPRFDFQTVNFPLIQFFLAEKFNEKDLSSYRLL